MRRGCLRHFIQPLGASTLAVLRLTFPPTLLSTILLGSQWLVVFFAHPSLPSHFHTHPLPAGRFALPTIADSTCMLSSHYMSAIYSSSSIHMHHL